MGQEDEEQPPEGEAAGPEESPREREAREDEAFRAALKHYSRRARLFKS